MRVGSSPTGGTKTNNVKSKNRKDKEMKVNLNTEFGVVNVPAKELVVDGCHTNIIKLGNSIIRLPSKISYCDISLILLYGGIPVTGIMDYYVGDNVITQREQIRDYVLIRQIHPTKREFELQII